MKIRARDTTASASPAIEDSERGDDITKGDIALDLVPQVIAFVALSFVLRWPIERWVDRYPPRPGTRELEG